MNKIETELVSSRWLGSIQDWWAEEEAKGANGGDAFGETAEDVHDDVGVGSVEKESGDGRSD